MLGFFIFIAAGLSFLLVVIGIALFIAHLLKNRKETLISQIKTEAILKVYFYTISFISLIIFAFGATLMTKSLIGYVSYPLSYRVIEKGGYPRDYYLEGVVGSKAAGVEKVEHSDMVKVEWKGKIYYKESVEEQSTDTLVGVTLALSMLIIFILHRYGLMLLNSRTGLTPLLEKFYSFSSLIVYGVASIVSIPAAIYLTLRLLLVEKNLTSYFELPGEILALTICFIPIWIYFLIRCVNLFRAERKQ